MFFKNLSVYRLPAKWNMSRDALEKAITPLSFVPCTSVEMERTGWVPAVEHGRLVHWVNQQFMLRLQTEKKLLPAAVITQVAKAKAAEMEEQQGFKPGRKQMKELKEQVADELLPRAFSINSAINVWIDPVNGWMGIDSASNSKIELVMRFLLKAIPNFPVDSLRTEMSPATAMTEWLLTDEAPSNFTVDNQSELQSTGEGKATVAYKNQSVDPANVKKHIVDEGKKCTKLALTWNDRLSFVLTEGLVIKRISPLDSVSGEIGKESGSPEEMFDADLALMAGEFNALLIDLTEALGGIQEERQAA